MGTKMPILTERKFRNGEREGEINWGEMIPKKRERERYKDRKRTCVQRTRDDDRLDAEEGDMGMLPASRSLREVFKLTI
jgi:hypothetical protein